MKNAKIILFCISIFFNILMLWRIGEYKKSIDITQKRADDIKIQYDKTIRDFEREASGDRNKIQQLNDGIRSNTKNFKTERARILESNKDFAERVNTIDSKLQKIIDSM